MVYAAFQSAMRWALLPLGVFCATTLGFQQPLNSQSCNVYMGQAVTGASVNVDRCSIQRVSERSTNFTYYLGQMRIQAQAHCRDNTWTTFHDQVVHSPQSTATQNMMNFVCGNGSSSGGNNGGGTVGVTNTALVFAPPSNVRTYPNGPILCTVQTQRRINLYGSQGSWFYTDACGSMGVIHNSQLRF